MAFTFEFTTPELFLSGKKKLDSCWISPTSEHQEEVHEHLSCCCPGVLCIQFKEHCCSVK